VASTGLVNPQVGDSFNDGQGRSVVVAIAGQPRVTDISGCPGAQTSSPPPPSSSTTSTPPPSSSTTTSTPPSSEPTSLSSEPTTETRTTDTATSSGTDATTAETGVKVRSMLAAGMLLLAVGLTMLVWSRRWSGGGATHRI
jgi:hypothetical protein